MAYQFCNRKLIKKITMRITKKQIGVFVTSLACFGTMQAQEITDTIPGAVEKLNSSVNALQNLKVSGYVQAQAQFVEKQDDPSFKVPSVAGGDFDAYSSNWARYGVRRGRVKFTYSSSPLSSAVLQFDATEKGVGVKDAYLKFTDHTKGFATIKAGIFDRPFGYEIEYSSSSRETPERSRMFQAFFPNERDLGVMLTLQAPKTSKWNYLKLDVASIAGNGINKDIDRFKDVIVRGNANKTFLNEQLKISGGISYYYGGFANQTETVYTVDTDPADTTTKFIANTDVANKNERSLKKLLGFDLQVSYDAPWGLTTIRGEYIEGQQPSTSSSNVYPTTAPSSDIYNTTAKTDDEGNTTYTTKLEKKAGDTYLRNTNGFYVYYVQNILQSPHQFVIKYDAFDPNTKISGLDINKANKFSTADIKFNTLGLGYIYKIDANTKITFYYDIVKNENTSLAETKDSEGKVTDPGWLDNRKDNVLTIRLQYKF